MHDGIDYASAAQTLHIFLYPTGRLLRPPAILRTRPPSSSTMLAKPSMRPFLTARRYVILSSRLLLFSIRGKIAMIFSCTYVCACVHALSTGQAAESAGRDAHDQASSKIESAKAVVSDMLGHGVVVWHTSRPIARVVVFLCIQAGLHITYA